MVNEKEIEEALGNLKNVLQEKKLTIFNETQVLALIEVADFWISFHKLIKFILWLWNPIKWLLTAGGIWITFKSGGITDVLKGFFK